MPTKVRLVKAMVFPVVMNGCESWTVKKDEHQRIDAFERWCWRKLLRVPLDCKEIQPANPKGNQPWMFIGRTDAEAETPIIWPPDEKNWLIWKDLDAGKDWRQEEKGMTEDEMAGWYHQLNEFQKNIYFCLIDYAKAFEDQNWGPKNWFFWAMVLEKTLESHLDSREIQPVHPKGNQSWIFIGRTDAEAETPIIWPPDAENWLIWKDPDAEKDWGKEEKGATDDRMVGWHHQLNGHEFEQTPGDSEG